jgi:hypothetical protein
MLWGSNRGGGSESTILGKDFDAGDSTQKIRHRIQFAAGARLGRARMARAPQKLEGFRRALRSSVDQEASNIAPDRP